MEFTQCTEAQRRTMLWAIGVDSIDDLTANIPPAFRLRGPLDIPAGLSEPELRQHLGELASRNHSCAELVCFAGAGAYDHFIPAVVDALAGQGAFLTAYTPYQAEASQGSLQAFFEFQTMICQLTGMEVANASLYDGSTALAEAVQMARTVTRRDGLVISAVVHPEHRTVLDTYARQLNIKCASLPYADGTTDLNALPGAVSAETAAVVVQSPNFFGCAERLDRVGAIARDAGALLIVVTDPLAGAMFKRPGDCGADICVAEGQPLGIPLAYGGPYLGLFACRREYLRKMPGRIVGMARDADGRRGFCLTIQTREQHIKRERATSNVCTNQGLMALRAAVYMAAMGRQGIAKVANLCFDKAHYAARRIAGLDGFSLPFGPPFFKEFVVRTQRDVSEVMTAARKRGLIAGVPLGRWYEELHDCFLVAVTEQRTRAQIDALVEALAAVGPVGKTLREVQD